MSSITVIDAVISITMCFVFFAYALLQLSLTRSYLRRCQRRNTLPKTPILEQAELPFITVQLPVYNEKYVVERLIDHVMRLKYPKEKLEIQVLDDSTDETVELIVNQVQKYRSDGFNIQHVRRGTRVGFKAGALRHGLTKAKGEFVCIFDADFLPASDYLLTTIRYFEDPTVAVVQTRWSYINKVYSLLTEVQALILDTHFTVEQGGRSEEHCFINFNGSGGQWRSAAIHDAGNWSGDTLTEDIDLSYRAQLRGWRFVYLDTVESPSELPDNIRAFRSQQYRWMKGGAQNAVRLIPQVLRADLGTKVKIHACAHLLATSLYVVLLIIVLLTVPLALLGKDAAQASWSTSLLLFPVNWLVLGFVYLAPQRSQLRGFDSSIGVLWIWLNFLFITTGMCVHNGLAALSGWFSGGGEFVRTPKRDTISTSAWESNDSYLPKKFDRTILFEILVWLYLLVGLIVATEEGLLHLTVGPIMAFVGLSYLLANCVYDRFRQRVRSCYIATLWTSSVESSSREEHMDAKRSATTPA